MEGISDIRISGLDERRPPRIRDKPYIDLYFKLIHKAPADWCAEFNQRVSKGKYPVKIDPSAGLFIETWVRNPDEIAGVLDGLKAAVSKCSEAYVARIEAEASAAANVGVNPDDVGEQGRLNRIIAGLNFDIEMNN